MRKSRSDKVEKFKVDFLRTFNPFNTMNEEILLRLIEVTYDLKRTAGQTIIRKGETGAEKCAP
jgi:hypothetical protein